MARENEKPYVYIKGGDIVNLIYGATSRDIERQDPDFKYYSFSNRRWQVSSNGNYYKEFQGNVLIRFSANKGKLPKRAMKRKIF